MQNRARTDIIGQRGSVLQVAEREIPEGIRAEVLRILAVCFGCSVAWRLRQGLQESLTHRCSNEQHGNESMAQRMAFDFEVRKMAHVSMVSLIHQV